MVPAASASNHDLLRVPALAGLHLSLPARHLRATVDRALLFRDLLGVGEQGALRADTGLLGDGRSRVRLLLALHAPRQHRLRDLLAGHAAARSSARRARLFATLSRWQG